MPEIVEHLLRASLPLGLLALLARLLARRMVADSPWDARLDLSLALAGGLIFGVLCALELADGILQSAPVTGADFHDYCGSIGASRGDHDSGWRASRSFAAGALPSLLARRYGVIDGLLLGAFVSQVVLGAGIYIWGRALHSRLAGISAVMVACAVAPLVILGRTLTFYPEIVAVSVMASGLSVLALRTRKQGALLACGLGAGLVLLMDVRGLIWAPPMLAVGGLAALLQPSWRRRAAGLLLLGLPLMISNHLAPQVFLPGVPSLERQVESYANDARIFLGERPEPPPSARPGQGAVWGRTPLIDLPSSLMRAFKATSGFSALLGSHEENRQERQLHIVPWVGVVGASMLIAVWGLRRRFTMLIGLTVPLLPFISAIYSASWILFRPRYLSMGMAVVPVLIGVSIGVLAHGSLRARDLQSHVRPGMALPAAFAMFLLLVLGWVPSWYSPQADWRHPINADKSLRDALNTVKTGTQVGPRAGTRCTQTLEADLAAGLPLGSALLGWRPQ